MKIMVLNGSPKAARSCTMNLTKAFIEGSGWSDVETIEVANANIKGCKGCFACWNKTPGRCVIEDGMNAILQKMVEANVVIWSFPLYYFNVPGTLKNLIDRQLPTVLPYMSKNAESGGHPSRYDRTHQRHAVISTCGFWTAVNNYASITAMFDKFLGKSGYERIFCGQGDLFNVAEVRERTDAYLEIVRQAGAQFAVGGIASETRALLSEPLFPKEIYENASNEFWDK